jgi:cell division protein FtsL
MPARTQRPAYNRNRTTAYVDGNTVRVTQPAAVPQRQYGTAAAQKRRIQERPARRLRVRYQEAAQTASVSITRGSTFLLLAAVVAALFIGYNYLCLKSSLDVHMDTIKSLETRLDNLRTENDALERSIDTSVDLNYVYSVAVNELGMVRVGQGNIIQYDKTESEYVRQYEDLPAAN